MWAKQPNFTPEQLKSIGVPVAIAVGEYDEAIKQEHTKEMASLIPGSTLIIMPNLSHFAMWQGPEGFQSRSAEVSGYEIANNKRELINVGSRFYSNPGSRAIFQYT